MCFVLEIHAIQNCAPYSSDLTWIILNYDEVKYLSLMVLVDSMYTFLNYIKIWKVLDLNYILS